MQPLTMQPTQAGRRVDPDRPSAEARPINQGRALVSPFAIRRRGPVCGRSGQGAKQAPAFPLLPNPPRPLPWRPAGRPLPEPEPVRRLLSPYAGQWSPCAGCFTPPPAAATLGSVQPLDLIFTLDRMSHSYGGLALRRKRPQAWSTHPFQPLSVPCQPLVRVASRRSESPGGCQWISGLQARRRRRGAPRVANPRATLCDSDRDQCVHRRTGACAAPPESESAHRGARGAHRPTWSGLRERASLHGSTRKIRPGRGDPSLGVAGARQRSGLNPSRACCRDNTKPP